MRLHVLICTKNEASRYLDCVLNDLMGLDADIVVFDDQSDDDTVELALDYGCQVIVRGTAEPTFSDNEGFFRQNAWNYFELITEPDETTWILSLDADEMIVGDVNKAIREADGHGFRAIQIPIPEVFSLENGPQIRVDGFWKGLSAPRLFKWAPRGEFGSQTLGGGSTPSYVASTPAWRHSGRLSILHLGYLDPEDRVVKYNRYVGQPGHSPRHIQSILTPPTLEPWTGECPEVWRGIRYREEKS